MNVIIAGGRDFSDYETLKRICDAYFSVNGKHTIVCGKARGADTLGEKYAKENRIDIKYFPADWNKFGKSAGYKRNVQMAENADALIAFWDGKSKGTQHMINIAKEKNLSVFVVYYPKL